MIPMPIDTEPTIAHPNVMRYAVKISIFLSNGDEFPPPNDPKLGTLVEII